MMTKILDSIMGGICFFIMLFIPMGSAVSAAGDDQGEYNQNLGRCVSTQKQQTDNRSADEVETRQSLERSVNNSIVIPREANGHEEEYLSFLRISLVCGFSKIPIRELNNPLSDRFNLSSFQNVVGRRVVFLTGYPTKDHPHYVDSLVVWIAPRFLVAANISGNASQFAPIMADWPVEHEIGIFWTCGSRSNNNLIFNLTTENMEQLCRGHLLDKFLKSDGELDTTFGMLMQVQLFEDFVFSSVPS